MGAEIFKHFGEVRPLFYYTVKIPLGENLFISPPRVWPLLSLSGYPPEAPMLPPRTESVLSSSQIPTPCLSP